MEQRERRDTGLLYRVDDEVVEEIVRARRLIHKYNMTDPCDTETLRTTLETLLGAPTDANITQPFYCDYGNHIHLGKGFFSNYNCTILDVATVTFGDNCLLGPNVAVYTAGHPVDPDLRRTGYEFGAPVTVGRDVWIGGNTVICPGVAIGDGCVIGAGSVVTRDIPPYSVAAGNPCRVLRSVTEADRRTYFRGRLVDEEVLSYMRNMKNGEGSAIE